MKIDIVGAGPAGLFLAVLLKEKLKSCQVHIWERSLPYEDRGWGIVLSVRALKAIEVACPSLVRELRPSLINWQFVRIVHRGEAIGVETNHYFSCPRSVLIGALYRLCRQHRVSLSWGRPIGDPQLLAAKTDLLVGADGSGSIIRKAYETDFGFTKDIRPNRFIWLGTSQKFEGLNLIFKNTLDGVFCAHAYCFDSHHSTFIVECSNATWERSGLAQDTLQNSIRRLEAIFSDSLSGCSLLLGRGQGQARWTQFSVVKNERWNKGNVVLLGDALHTVHFSIGSGTSLAVESAQTVVDSIVKFSNLPDALAFFETSRKPIVEKIQASAEASMRWFERMDDCASLTPLEMAYSCMTRSGRLGWKVCK